MKKIKFALFAFMVALTSFAFTACDDDDKVEVVPVTGVSVGPETLELKEGTTGTLTAAVVPSNATVATVTWSSSDESVATVDKGVVTAVAEGTATITAKTDDGGFTATCNVTVTKETPAFDESKYHFDLFLTVGKHGGMSSKNTTVVNSISKLTADMGVITITGEGTELNDYAMECISKGKYYYQIPSDENRFVKYQIKDNKVVVIKDCPFKGNVYKVRSYTHAWLDDNTLLIMSANGKKTGVIWTKLNTADMSIIDEGELNISVPEGYSKLTSSGILTYRQADNKLFYFYYGKTQGTNSMDSKNEPNFRTAVIAPETMEVEQNLVSPVHSEMAGSAYGELMQNCVMYDEADNLYLACFHEEASGIEKGMLLRIKVGATEFDTSYNGYQNADGKLMTVQYLGNNKALVYARNDKAPISDKAAAAGIKKPTAIDAFSHYYTVIDLATGTKTRLSYDGKEIGYSGGRFSQRSVIFNNKAYIGVNTEEDANAVIYIYDIKTGNVEKGAEVDGRFYFDMIRVIEND